MRCGTSFPVPPLSPRLVATRSSCFPSLFFTQHLGSPQAPRNALRLPDGDVRRLRRCAVRVREGLHVGLLRCYRYEDLEHVLRRHDPRCVLFSSFLPNFRRADAFAQFGTRLTPRTLRFLTSPEDLSLLSSSTFVPSTSSRHVFTTPDPFLPRQHDVQTGRYCSVFKATWVTAPAAVPIFTIGDMQRVLDVVSATTGTRLAGLTGDIITSVPAATAAHPVVPGRYFGGTAAGKVSFWSPKAL